MQIVDLKIDVNPKYVSIYWTQCRLKNMHYKKRIREVGKKCELAFFLSLWQMPRQSIKIISAKSECDEQQRQQQHNGHCIFSGKKVLLVIPKKCP